MASHESISALLAYLREAYPATFTASSDATTQVWTDAIPKDCPDHLLLPAARSMIRSGERFATAAALCSHLDAPLEQWRTAERERRAAARLKLETHEEPAATGAKLDDYLEKLNRAVGRRAAAMREPNEADKGKRKTEQLDALRRSHGEA